MKQLKYAALAVLCAWCGATAAAQPKIALDQATFAYSNGTLVEFYLGIDAASLGYASAEDGTYWAPLALVLELGNEGGTAWRDTLRLQLTVADPAALAQGQHFIHQIRAVAPPGTYRLTVAEPGGGAPLLRSEVTLPDYGGEAPLSDVTLATAVTESENRESLFYKHGFEIQPSATLLYGAASPHLYYYAEVYGSEAAAGAEGEYTVQAYVQGAAAMQPVEGLTRTHRRQARAVDLLVGYFEAGALPNGSYALHLDLVGADSTITARQSRRFFVYNPDVERAPAVDAGNGVDPMLASLSPAEVEEAFAYLELIATEREKRRMREAETHEERITLVQSIWRARDPEPRTALNEYREDFYRRIRKANEQYSNNFTEGWQTDRGRVLVVYGEPVGIETRYRERNLVPHEIWQYVNLRGENVSFFIFADRNGFGRFELIHATVAGERKLTNWERELRR